jgi:hypothetical protein
VQPDGTRPPYRMDADELALVRLRLGQGRNYAAIAAELGVGREAVKWQARTMRKKENA